MPCGLQIPMLQTLHDFDFSYNSFNNCSYSIYFFSCSDAVISHNTFTNCVPSTSGIDCDAILLWTTGYGPPAYSPPRMDLIDNVTVSYNTISNCKHGINLGTEDYSGQTATISNIEVVKNEVSGATEQGIALYSYRYGDAVPLPTYESISIHCNLVWRNQVGLGITAFKGPNWNVLDGFSLVGVHVNNNNVYDNDLGGTKQGFNVEGDVTMGTVDAKNNRWGSATGPTNPGNPSGTGDKVTDKVVFSPWLTGLSLCAPSLETPVGGTWAPITLQALSSVDTLQLLTPWIALVLIAAAFSFSAYKRLFKKR